MHIWSTVVDNFKVLKQKGLVLWSNQRFLSVGSKLGVSDKTDLLYYSQIRDLLCLCLWFVVVLYLYLYEYVEVTNSGLYPTVERAPSIYWWLVRADLKLSTLVAHTTESSGWFQSFRVYSKNEFENWCVLLDEMSKHFVLFVLHLFFSDVSCLVVLNFF